MRRYPVRRGTPEVRADIIQGPNGLQLQVPGVLTTGLFAVEGSLFGVTASDLIIPNCEGATPRSGGYHDLRGRSHHQRRRHAHVVGPWCEPARHRSGFQQLRRRRRVLLCRPHTSLTNVTRRARHVSLRVELTKQEQIRNETCLARLVTLHTGGVADRLIDVLREAGADVADPDGMVEAFMEWADRRGSTLYPHQEEAVLELYTGGTSSSPHPPAQASRWWRSPLTLVPSPAVVARGTPPP